MTGSTNGQSSPSGAETTGRIIVALFQERSGAEDAIRDLKNAGFTNEQIGVATQESTGAVEPQRSERTADPGDTMALDSQDEPDNRDKIVNETASGLAEGAAAGALTGGVIGGLVGLISSLLIPGLGPLIVGGVLAASLMGVGLGAATGGLIGALVGMGVPEEDARYFDAGLRQGRTLLTVTSTNEAPDKAISILERHGGDLGPSRARSSAPASYPGAERRTHADAAYPGPERRFAGV
jgi:hypothetical protein